MVPVVGPHVELIKTALKLWGVHVQMDQPEHWNDAALASWKDWLTRQYGNEEFDAIVDSKNINMLIDLENYKTWLHRAYPTDDSLEEDGERCLQIQRFIEDDMEYLAEVIDEETGETLNVSLPDEVAEEVR